MSLETFSLFVDKTTLIACNNTVFKLKLEYEELPPANKTLFRQAVSEKSAHCQIEDACRAFFYMLETSENLHPIQTDHFLIYPDVRQWPLHQKIQFFIDGKPLNCHKDVILLRVVCKDVTKLKLPQNNVLSTCSKHQEEVNGGVTNVIETIPPTSNAKTTEVGQYNSDTTQRQQQCHQCHQQCQPTFLDKQPSVAVTEPEANSHFQGLENISLDLGASQTKPAPTLRTRPNSVGVVKVSQLLGKQISGKERKQVDHKITIRRASPMRGTKLKKVAVEYPMQAELSFLDTFKQSDSSQVCPELIFNQSDPSQVCLELTFSQSDTSHLRPEVTFNQSDTSHLCPEVTFNQSDPSHVSPEISPCLENASTPDQSNTRKRDLKNVIRCQKQTFISIPRENRSRKSAQDLCSDEASDDLNSYNLMQDIHQYHTRAVLSGKHVIMKETRHAAGGKLTTKSKGNTKKTYSREESGQKTVNKSFTKQSPQPFRHKTSYRKNSKDDSSASLTSVQLNKKAHEFNLSCLTPEQRPDLINKDPSSNDTASSDLGPSPNKAFLKFIRLKHLSTVSDDKHSSADHSNNSMVSDTEDCEGEGAESRLSGTRYNRLMTYNSGVVGSNQNSGNSQQELREKEIPNNATPSHSLMRVTRQGKHLISQKEKTRGKEEHQNNAQNSKNCKFTKTVLAPDDNISDFSAGSKYDVAADASRRITRFVSGSPSSRQTKLSSSSQENSSWFSSQSNHKSQNLITAEDSRKLKKAKRKLLSSKDGVWLF